MELLSRILFLASNALLAPTMLGLCLAAGWSLVALGAMIREAVGRWRSRNTFAAWSARWTQPQDATEAVADFFSRRDYAGWVGEFARRAAPVRDAAERVAHTAAELEIESARMAARLSLVVRLAPTLGLMGTLIPLGPALIGLSRGDLETLANALTIAFSTTVVGLFAAGVAYAIGFVRRDWTARDLNDIELVRAWMDRDSMTRNESQPQTEPDDETSPICRG